MYYVYCYKDPDTLLPFYIGKGKWKTNATWITSTKRSRQHQIDGNFARCRAFCQKASCLYWDTD
jgi:hypothetical protein